MIDTVLQFIFLSLAACWGAWVGRQNLKYEAINRGHAHWAVTPRLNRKPKIVFEWNEAAPGKGDT